MNDVKFIAKCSEILGPKGLITEKAEMQRYCTDWRGMFKGDALAVALPANRDEVVAIVRHCANEGLAIVPSGGNTGLAGGSIPDASGRQVVLSMERMNNIRSIDAMAQTMELEAGCILAIAQDAAERADLMLPISFAAEGSAQIGGVIATNAGGINVVRYGMARQRILGLEIVLADGRIVNGLRHLQKNNSGYDWKHWFIGSEGTLAIITAAVLQLTARPRYTETALLCVPSVDAALQCLHGARQAVGETICAFEFMSGGSVNRVIDLLGHRRLIAESPWYVIIEAASALSGLSDAFEKLLSNQLSAGTVSNGLIAKSESQRSEIWRLRESLTEAEAKAGKSIKHDISVPVSALAEFLTGAHDMIERRFPDIRLNIFGHMGDGNIHFNALADARTDSEKLNRCVHDLVIAAGGSISAEHGIGQYRVSELLRLSTEVERDISLRIKRTLDPSNLLNPGKILGPSTTGN
jgi:FAD/FMN-containing dehydrogenase